MSNPNGINPKKLNEVLGTASQKLGTSAEQLKKQVEDGKIDDIMKKLPQKQAENLKNILNNPEQAKKMLQSPQAQQLMKQLFGKKNK